MEWSQLFENIGKAASVLGALVGGWWAVEKWRKRDEHFPRVWFEVSANFVGCQDAKVVTELVAVLENKGIVPLKIKRFEFKLRGLKRADVLVPGDERIRSQLLFPHFLEQGSFVPKDWEYSFVYPGVKTEYNFVTTVHTDITFVRLEAEFEYMVNGETHHAAKILRVLEFGTTQCSPPSIQNVLTSGLFL